jgi:hypothetical protein
VTARAGQGKYLPPQDLLLSESRWAPQRPVLQKFEVEDCQTFISPQEQAFYDWCLGILEDSGVVGVLKNERLYLGSECRADLHIADTTYELELSRTSVYFGHKDTRALRLLFPDAGTATDGDVVETRHIRSSFEVIRRQSVLNRLWAACTDLVSIPAAGIGNLRLDKGRSLVAVEVETSLGECTVDFHRGSDPNAFRYSVTDAGRSLRYSPRIADALISDLAEDLGGCPEPETLLDVMIGTYNLAQTDYEWLSIGAG